MYIICALLRRYQTLALLSKICQLLIQLLSFTRVTQFNNLWKNSIKCISDPRCGMLIYHKMGWEINYFLHKIISQYFLNYFLHKREVRNQWKRKKFGVHLDFILEKMVGNKKTNTNKKLKIEKQTAESEQVCVPLHLQKLDPNDSSRIHLDGKI